MPKRSLVTAAGLRSRAEPARGTAVAEGRGELRKKGFSWDAVPRLKMGESFVFCVFFFFAGESDQSKGRELQVVIFGGLLVKQLNEATSQSASPNLDTQSFQPVFGGSLLNVNEQPSTRRQTKKDLAKTM